MTTPANPDDLITWLWQQLENQRFRAESLKTLAFALPPETGAYLTDTAEILLGDVDAKRRILDAVEEQFRPGDILNGAQGTNEAPWLLRVIALPYADREGFREEWRP